MANKTAALVRPLVEKAVEQAGYLLWDLDFFKEGADFNLLVSLENKDPSKPVGLEDCEKVSRILSPLLDKEDPIPFSYTLEVSSAGLERPLKTEEHFLLSLGKKVRVGLYAPLNGAKQLEGTLVRFENKSVTLETSEGETVTLEDYAKIVALHE